ncbi:hypothetical protein HMPREF1572_01235 [Gardnerella vaginalis JCP7275]|nr:hypothetical protein HMPREF1572_01235 [Gardnerella vaginalis JCP7275]
MEELFHKLSVPWFTAQKTIKSVAIALEQSRTQLHLGIHAEVTATRSTHKAQAE